mgnify:FL=1
MNINELPEIIPIFPLSGALLLPKGNLPLNIFEPRYIDMINFAMKNEKMIGMIQEKKNSPKTKDLYLTGCLGRINQYNETNDGRYLINLSGIIRFHIVKEEKTFEKFRKMKVSYLKFKHDLTSNIDNSFDKKIFLNEVRSYLEKNNIEVDWNIIQKINETILITTLASICPFSDAEKQMILECENPNEIPKAMVNLFKMIGNNLASKNLN